MKLLQRLAILAFSLCLGAFAQVNIYNPPCAADGTDQTSCFNNAFANDSDPAHHQTVAVGPGTYTIAGTIKMQTWQTLVGAGPTQTTLKFTSPSACSSPGLGAGIVIASSTDNPSSNLGGGLGGLQHLTVYGPVCQTPPNQSYPNQPVGVLLGGDPNNNINTGNPGGWWGDDVRLEDVAMLGWVTGVELGDYSWSDTFQHVRLNSNLTQHFYVPAHLQGSGEKIVVLECQFVNGAASTIGILDATGIEWMIDHSTFDSLGGPAIVVAGVNPEGNHLNISHSHFETSTLSSSGFITNQYGSMSGTPTISIQDTTFLVDSGSSAPAMINTSSQVSQLNIVGGWVDSAQAIYFVNTAKSMWIQSVGGNATGNMTGAVKTPTHPSLITNVFGGSFNEPH